MEQSNTLTYTMHHRYSASSEAHATMNYSDGIMASDGINFTIEIEIEIILVD